MWNFKYGVFTDEQMVVTKKYMQKQIYFLLLCVDENTNVDYQDINIVAAFDNILKWFGGLNEVLFYPSELVKVVSLLEAAKLEYLSDNFKFSVYRKLVLDAGAEVMKIEGVE